MTKQDGLVMRENIKLLLAAKSEGPMDPTHKTVNMQPWFEELRRKNIKNEKKHRRKM